jgi:predicted RecB family nuclease
VGEALSVVMIGNYILPMPSSLRTCPNGHRYYKSSDCPVCPKCEAAKVPEQDFLKTIAAPARRALDGIGVKTLMQLARFTEAEIAALHGMGPNAIGKLRAALRTAGSAFKKT